MNKKLYTVICVLIATSLSLLNITYGANTTANAATDTAAQVKTSNTGAIVGGVAAATVVAGGITAAVISNIKDEDNSSDKVSSSDELDRQLQSILDKYRKEYNVPGLSMSVSLSPNSRTRNYVSGTTKLNGSQPINADTIFQIGSNTKAFTSAIILQLEAEGKLNINDTLGKYLPNMYPKWNNVKLINLMNMTSGIDSYTDEEFGKKILLDTIYRTKTWTLKELADYAYNKYSNLDDPGEYNYSNTNYILLGMVIEKVTGNSYQQELYQRLIGANAPLGLKNTHYISSSPLNFPPYIKNNMAYSYIENSYIYGNTTVHDITDMSLSSSASAGGMISTPREDVIWDRALFSGKVLPAKQQQELENECVHLTDPDDVSAYCLGVSYLKNYKVTDNLILQGKTWTYFGSQMGQNFAYELLSDSTVIVIAENASYADHFLDIGAIGITGKGNIVPDVILAIEQYKKAYHFQT